MNAPHPDLQRNLDDELRPAARARVDAHLAGCPGCAGEVRAFRALLSALAALPESPAPPPLFLAARIVAAAAADRAARRRPRWLEVLGTAYTGSAFGLLLALGVSPWRDDLLGALRGAGSLLVEGSVGALVGAFDRVVSLLTAVVALREAAAPWLLPLAPLGRSLEVLLAQPELRAGLAVAFVLTTALWWMLDHRPVGGRGRMNDVPAFF